MTATMSNGFSVTLFFFFLIAVVTLLTLNCPVTGRNYQTGNVRSIMKAADGTAGDSLFPGASKMMLAMRRNRRALKLDRRTCFSASGNPGYCTTLHSCYPNLSQSQLSVQETWMIISRNKCQYPGENGKGQVTGVCCMQPHDQKADSSSSTRPVVADKPAVSPPIKDANPVTNSLVESPQQQQYYSGGIQPNHFMDLFSRPTAAAAGSSGHKDGASSGGQQPTKQTTFSQCGRGPAKLIQRAIGISQAQAKKNSWPFLVALRYDGTVKCGGSLISSNKILTAAHCVERMSSFDISKMTVSLGMHTVGNGADYRNDAQVTRRVTYAAIHNGYNDATFVNDIAILTLDSPVVYSTAVSPVCLPEASDAQQIEPSAGQEVAMMGWGDLKYEKTRSNTLQEVKGTVVTNAECMDDYAMEIADEMLCVSAPVQSACQGDSGGPVVVQSASGAWTVVGVNSFTLECGSLPGIKTKVSAFRKWIDLHLK